VARQGHPAEFRRRVLDLIGSDRKIADVAADLGISEQTIYSWRRQDRIDQGLDAGLSGLSFISCECSRHHCTRASRKSETSAIRICAAEPYVSRPASGSSVGESLRIASEERTAARARNVVDREHGGPAPDAARSSVLCRVPSGPTDRRARLPLCRPDLERANMRCARLQVFA